MILCKYIVVLSIISICFIENISCHLLEGIYCGKENCYDVLDVSREATRHEIAKSYRKMARKFHPDMHRGEEAKEEASARFTVIATAYEILKDEEERTDYDYMLDNPQEYYAHYYRYYRRRMAPKVDVRIVLAVTISIISIVQYYSAWQKYDTAIKYFMTVPKYRNKALEMSKTETKEIQGKARGAKKISKTEQKEEIEKMIRKVIEDKLDIKGSYAKPEITDILWIQLLICPYTLAMYVIWYVKWIYKYNVMKHPYGIEEQMYLIRKNLGMGQHQFNALEEETIEDYLSQEIWDKENFKIWKEIQDEETKKSLADNNKYKQYRRYIKQHGANRMTFDDS